MNTNTIQQVARQASDNAIEAYFAKHSTQAGDRDEVADAVAVAVLREVNDRMTARLKPALNAGTSMEGLILAGSVLRESLAAFTPAEPPQQDYWPALERAVSSAVAPAEPPQQEKPHFVCPTCGPRVAVDEDGCCRACGADCVTSVAPAEPQTPEPDKDDDLSDHCEVHHRTHYPRTVKCAWCGESIQSGSLHTHNYGRWQGEKQDWRMHEECYEVADLDGALGDGFTLYDHERPKPAPVSSSARPDRRVGPRNSACVCDTCCPPIQEQADARPDRQTVEQAKARETLLHKIWEGKYLSMAQVELDVDAFAAAVCEVGAPPVGRTPLEREWLNTPRDVGRCSYQRDGVRCYRPEHAGADHDMGARP